VVYGSVWSVVGSGVVLIVLGAAAYAVFVWLPQKWWWRGELRGADSRLRRWIRWRRIPPTTFVVTGVPAADVVEGVANIAISFPDLTVESIQTTRWMVIGQRSVIRVSGSFEDRRTFGRLLREWANIAATVPSAPAS